MDFCAWTSVTQGSMGKLGKGAVIGGFEFSEKAEKARPISARVSLTKCYL
jgi:hypothetical protein